MKCDLLALVVLVVLCGCGPVPLANDYIAAHAVSIADRAGALEQSVAAQAPAVAEKIRAVALALPENAHAVAERAVADVQELAESVAVNAREVRREADLQTEWSGVIRVMSGPAKKRPDIDNTTQETMDLAVARTTAEIFSRIKSFVQKTLGSKIPFLAPRAPVETGWTPGSIAGLVTTLAGTAGALGLGARRVRGMARDRDSARRERDDCHDLAGDMLAVARNAGANDKDVRAAAEQHTAARQVHARRKLEEVEGTGSGV